MEPVTEGEYSRHTMIALYPDVDVCDQLHVAGGLEVSDLHVTLVYTGRVDDVDSNTLREAVEQVIGGRRPVQASINAVARFSGATVDDLDIIVALVDAPDLIGLRLDLLAALAERGVEIVDDHGFIPHMSLIYLPADDPGPWHDSIMRQTPITTTFTQLTVKYGDERTPYGFGATAEAVTRAYAQGWAASGGPWTPRVTAGARAAVELAVADPDRTGLLEATVQLGHLEGVWAQIFARRDQLHADTAAAMLKEWGGLVDAVDVAGTVGDAEDAAAGFDGTPEARTGLVTTVTGYVLTALRSMQHEPSWAQLEDVLTAAVTAAHAEGQVDTVALAAERSGHTGGFDYDQAHADAAGTLAGREDMRTAARSVLHTAVVVTAAYAARKLVAAIVDGEPTSVLEDRLRDDLADGSLLAVEVGNALDVAFSAAVWSLLLRVGMSKTNVVTVGDGKVCARCVDAEEQGPYSLFDAPILPLHYGCRCTLDAAETVPSSLFITYLLGR